MKTKKFSILITTKNRLEELKYTLQEIEYLLNRKDVECIICDDGSTDGTSSFIINMYPTIKLISNKKSKGLIYSRNRLLNLTSANYAISLDDDAHFITNNPLEIIEDYFKNNQQCGVLAFRIYWGKILPKVIDTTEQSIRVKGFVGCGHVWNMKAWNEIPNYPDWFVFYGEEDFAAFQLFKKEWQIYYVPEIVVHHRVSLQARKNKKDYQVRLRRSLRSGWYLYFLFYPFKLIPKKMIYTLWMQIKLKVFKGDFKALIAIIQALFDVAYNTFKLSKNSNRLTSVEFKEYSKLPNTKLYWNPKNQ
jgi:glycosyltransferase involved in cell wall biosynthesis